jgi:hypothetical protein
MADHYDEEKAAIDYIKPDAEFTSDEPELPPNLARIAHRGFFGTLRHFEAVLDNKLGVEAYGPARILPEERDPKYGKWSHQVVMCLMWASGTMNLSCFATGFLGWEFGLDLSTTIYITILASFAGSAITVCRMSKSRMKKGKVIENLGLVCYSGSSDRSSTSLN